MDLRKLFTVKSGSYVRAAQFVVAGLALLSMIAAFQPLAHRIVHWNRAIVLHDVRFIGGATGSLTGGDATASITDSLGTVRIERLNWFDRVMDVLPPWAVLFCIGIVLASLAQLFANAHRGRPFSSDASTSLKAASNLAFLIPWIGIFQSFQRMYFLGRADELTPAPVMEATAVIPFWGFAAFVVLRGLAEIFDKGRELAESDALTV